MIHLKTDDLKDSLGRKIPTMCGMISDEQTTDEPSDVACCECLRNALHAARVKHAAPTRVWVQTDFYYDGTLEVWSTDERMKEGDEANWHVIQIKHDINDYKRARALAKLTPEEIVLLGIPNSD